MAEEEKLTGKQEAWINAYCECRNATEAARIAGYKNPNKLGPRQLVKIGIQQALTKRFKQAAMSADEALARLAKVGGDKGHPHQVRALEIILKAHGAFNFKQEIYQETVIRDEAIEKWLQSLRMEEPDELKILQAIAQGANPKKLYEKWIEELSK